MKYKGVAIVGVVILALAFIGLTQAETNSHQKTFDVKQGGTLYLNTEVGTLEIESHGRNTVDIDIEIKGPAAKDFHVQMKQEGNDVKVYGDLERTNYGSHAKARFIIKVPEKYNLDLRTAGGSIELSDLNGKVEAFTSGGSIELGRIVGNVQVKTSGGSIRVEEVAGNIDAHTSGGSITAKLAKQPSDDCRLTTSGGSITAYLSPSIAVDVKASTSGGRVRSQIDVDGTVRKSKISGKINGGGPELYLKTSGGSVNIKEI